MRGHTSLAQPIERTDLAHAYRRARQRTRSLFRIPVDEAYYDRPIALRNPIIFYEGHLPAFAVNTLVKLARGEKGLNAYFETLFERGIDPEDETAVRDPADQWPSPAEVQRYGKDADEIIERALLSLRDEPIEIEAARAIIEHEFMHQETLLYMFHNMPYERKRRPEMRMDRQDCLSYRASSVPASLTIPAGRATLGAPASAFAWDNEFPQHVVSVPAFEIDRDPVTNADYLRFMTATGESAPRFWTRVGATWFWRGMFELVPLPLDWPVFVSHDEAMVYARWQGKRLPSEAEHHRAAFGTPEGAERPITAGNFDLRSWDPQPVGCHEGSDSAWGVRDLVGNGWEWTSTIFDGFPGFRPMASYARYSADFFDGQHYVLKGASPVTARELVRPSFRNWFRPNYPYVFAKFRCVSVSS